MTMRTTDLDRVKALPLFRKITPEAFRDVTAGAFLQRFPAGTTLLMEGDQVDFLYVLLDGIVELQGTWKEKDTTLAVLRPVSTFILAAVVLDADALMSARTLERSEILMLSGQALRRTMRQDAEFALAVAEELSGCYRGLVRTVKNHKLRGGTERLANYLITQRIRQGLNDTIVLPHEKRILASLLGMTPENLSRAFAGLASHGVVVHGPEVTLTRPEALERLARPTPLIDNHMPPQSRVLGKGEVESWSEETGFA